MTPHFYLRFHYVTTRSSFSLKTIEKMYSDFVKQRKNVFLEIWRNGGKVFFSSLNIGNINFYKTNTMEKKKKCPDDDKRKFWCDNSFQSAATAFFLKIAKSVIVVSMTLRYHGNEWDDLPVLFQFSSKNILYFQYFKVSIKYYCRINYSYLPLSDVTDKQTSWLVDWRQDMTTAVQRYRWTCCFITFLRRVCCTINTESSQLIHRND